MEKLEQDQNTTLLLEDPNKTFFYHLALTYPIKQTNFYPNIHPGILQTRMGIFNIEA